MQGAFFLIEGGDDVADEKRTIVEKLGEEAAERALVRERPAVGPDHFQMTDHLSGRGAEASNEPRLVGQAHEVSDAGKDSEDDKDARGVMGIEAAEGDERRVKHR